MVGGPVNGNDAPPGGVVLFGRIGRAKYPDAPPGVLGGGVWDKDGDAVRCIESSGETYAAARDALVDLIPKGWVLLAVARWPLGEPRP
jgi:hypothetical protein